VSSLICSRSDPGVIFGGGREEERDEAEKDRWLNLPAGERKERLGVGEGCR
jgi:hypothetical protein